MCIQLPGGPDSRAYPLPVNDAEGARERADVFLLLFTRLSGETALSKIRHYEGDLGPRVSHVQHEKQVARATDNLRLCSPDVSTLPQSPYRGSSE